MFDVFSPCHWLAFSRGFGRSPQLLDNVVSLSPDLFSGVVVYGESIPFFSAFDLSHVRSSVQWQL
jgi:hypothetical protein